VLGQIEKKQQIESARQRVGWVYRDLLWFAEEETKQANQQRNELLEALADWVNFGCLRTKPHSGPLSPGCIICGTGGWGCNFINGLCTRRCFYCPQEHMKTEREPQTDSIIFKNPQEHISFIKIFQIRGVGFSGGEPLLALDRLLAHIKAIRQEFGNSVYLWIYSNGDRLNRGRLEMLQKAGLDEVRFDISARKYDLGPVYLAKEYIPTVTVEIPAIPEDFDLVKGLLGKMEAAGVNFLNLHQLMATEYNYKAFRRRNYHFLHQPHIAVFETEICALRLLLFARENQISLPINYCSSIYKSRFQGRDVRTRKSRILIKGFEEITNAGYIRSFRVLDAKDKLASLVHRLEGANCPPDRWQSDERQTEVAIHSELLPYVDWSSADVALLYWEPGIRLKEPEQGLTEGNIAPKNIKVYQEDEWSQAAIETWRQLYQEKANPKEAFKSFYQDYPVGRKDAVAKMQKEAHELKKLAEWEELESGLPEIY
jgi:pyruvate formate-lyase activating enzyme-like uncharacterized protein